VELPPADIMCLEHGARSDGVMHCKARFRLRRASTLEVRHRLGVPAAKQTLR
jgi:hypothetical protein